MSKYNLYGLVIQCLLAGMLLAEPSNAQKSLEDVSISLQLNEASIQQTFAEIEEKTGFSFYYRRSILKDKPQLSVSFENGTLSALLKLISKETALKFKRVNSNIFVNDMAHRNKKREVVEDFVFDVPVKGQVTDENGQGLPGVNVLIKGSSAGVVTDSEGNYTMNVPDRESILVFSYIGYLTEEVEVGEQSIINVQLLPDVSLLEEIVVVAYGEQKRSAITASVANIKSEELKGVTVPDVSSMIQGKAAGVQVSASSGRPGAVPDILIRGMASLNGSIVPLWVVDGVIQHTTPVVNPNDIESVSILKDASATSLYGSRGANGVIIVTTKRGESGVSKLSFTSKVGFNKFNDGNFRVMNSQQFYDYHTQLGTTQPWFTSDLLNRDYDWIEGGTQTGVVQDYTASYSTGTEKLNAYMTGGYYNETGTIKGSDFERLSFRMNLDYNASKRLILKPKIAFSFDDRHRAEHPRYELYLNLPWDLPFDANGSPVNAQTSQDWIGRDSRNYFYDLQWNFGTSNVFNMSTNADFEFEITDDLSFISTNNFTLLHSKSFDYTDPQSTGGESTGGSIREFKARRLTRLFTEMLRYSKTFGEHSVTALAGYEFNDYEYEDISAVGEGLIPGGSILNITSTPSNVGGFKNEYALQSMFLSADYAFGNRYYGKASIRRDGASNFGPEDRYGMFFALGAGWNIHNENFFDSNIIDELKLRVSYGSVGNRPSSLYPYQGTYSVSQQYDAVPAAVLRQFGNPDLTWEKSFETNIAVDARLFDRVTATFEYYHKNTSDLLYFVDLPSTTGFQGFWENVGGLKNSGFEVALSGEVFKTPDFSWDLGFNIGVNTNEITELFDGQTEIPRGSKIFKVGEDLNTWYLRKWVGVDSDNGNPLWERVDETTGEITQTSDYNQATLQPVGSATADYIGGINSNIRYKGLSLSANVSFSNGGLVYNGSRELFDSDGFYITFNQQIFADGWKRWENPGDIATHPRAISGGNNNSNKPSSRYLEDGSFMRLRNVTLAYDLNKTLLDQIGLSAARIYFSGDNLLTITDYSGLDPEARIVDGGGEIAGRSSLQYPVPKRFVFGLNFSF
ncbi:TonB-dependent receptor [Fulvivirgaceae bacterium BMA10]|uniref:TonB-dependent receptor n=1 Tax=Splendidivirga corallicola TaxID=3051826 RepID=A0ABT8KW58_9BACT|nr:TonB-dependent receptor [Fulvivirgaceae bacterium BMA10]